MFAGIVEAQSKLLEFKADVQNFHIKVEKPIFFDDLKRGDSIAVNGICLTVEDFNDFFIQFSIGAETLKITGWNEQNLSALPLNLERSLKLSDRLHGHFVSGHADGLAQVVNMSEQVNSRILTLKVLPEALKAFIWQKGSIALNGVSLTINKVRENEIEICIIPETIKRTNFSSLKVGDIVTVEVDQWARAVNRALELERVSREYHH